VVQTRKPAEEPANPLTPDEKTKPKTSPKVTSVDLKVPTPEEAIKQKIGETITVKFKVTAVITTRVSNSGRIAPDPDAGYHEVLILKAGDSLILQLHTAAGTLKRLDIDPEKHFKGKMVQVTGKLGPGPYHNLLPPGLY